jgi:hypothetical protein
MFDFFHQNFFLFTHTKLKMKLSCIFLKKVTSDLKMQDLAKKNFILKTLLNNVWIRIWLWNFSEVGSGSGIISSGSIILVVRI